MSAQDIKEIVKERYGAAARRVTTGEGSSCCGASAQCGTDIDPITRDLYDASQTGILPEEAVKASLGCGNPTALAELKPGETVLDLGSGGGIDVLLSARRVGPTGKAYGLDMTDDMLALARENQKKSGVTNVEFLRGEIENIPLPADSVDVISPIALSIFPPTKTACSARRSACSSRVAAWQFPMLWCTAKFLKKFKRAFCCGSAALPARCVMKIT